MRHQKEIFKGDIKRTDEQDTLKHETLKGDPQRRH